jgi:hypothetical protein
MGMWEWDTRNGVAVVTYGALSMCRGCFVVGACGVVVQIDKQVCCIVRRVAVATNDNQAWILRLCILCAPTFVPCRHQGTVADDL